MKGDQKMKNNKPTIYEFADNFYGIKPWDYESLNDYQKKAIELDYTSRYGSIRWF